MQKNSPWIFLGVIVCLLVAGGAVLLGAAMIESFYTYRSPLHSDPPQPGQTLGSPLTGRVVFVLVDALREDTARDAEVMPFLNQLRRQGASAVMYSRPPSYSTPSYAVLLTGAWPELNDAPVFNLPYEEIPVFTQDDIFSAAHRAGLQTAVSGYYWFEKLLPPQSVTAAYYTAGEDQAADRVVVDAALPWLESEDYQLVLIHLDQVDYAGHYEGGPRHPDWNAAASRVDDLLREITASLDLSRDTLLVTSDHGQIDRGGHGGHEAVVLTEPFILAGAAVWPGFYGDIDMVDVVPTIAALLGTNLPASAQGRVRTEMLVLDPDQSAQIAAATLSQQLRLAEKYQAAIGVSRPAPAGNDPVAVYQALIEFARMERLQLERLPRILAALLAGLLVGVIILARTPYLGRMLFGFVLYLAVFNLRYLGLDRMTYSFSSVDGPLEIVLYAGTTVLVAFGLSWLVAGWTFGLFQHVPGRAARLSFALAFVYIFILALPVLYSVALDGTTATWTLPDFRFSFLALISLIQILFIAILALPAAAISALAAAVNVKIRSRRRASFREVPYSQYD
jgi:hypothetical protein